MKNIHRLALFQFSEWDYAVWTELMTLLVGVCSFYCNKNLNTQTGVLQQQQWDNIHHSLELNSLKVLLSALSVQLRQYLPQSFRNPAMWWMSSHWEAAELHLNINCFMCTAPIHWQHFELNLSVALRPDTVWMTAFGLWNPNAIKINPRNLTGYEHACRSPSIKVCSKTIVITLLLSMRKTQSTVSLSCNEDFFFFFKLWKKNYIWAEMLQGKGLC